MRLVDIFINPRTFTSYKLLCLFHCRLDVWLNDLLLEEGFGLLPPIRFRVCSNFLSLPRGSIVGCQSCLQLIRLLGLLSIPDSCLRSPPCCFLFGFYKPHFRLYVSRVSILSLLLLCEALLFPGAFLCPFDFQFFHLVLSYFLAAFLLLCFECSLSGFFFLLFTSFFKSIGCCRANHGCGARAP